MLDSDPRRSALEATPKASPSGTPCTSVLDNDAENDTPPLHMQADVSEDPTLSQWSFDGHEFENDYQVTGQDGGFGPYLYPEEYHNFPENAYNGYAASEVMPTSVAGPQTPSGEAPQDHRP